jgi:hypothetical protein
VVPRAHTLRPTKIGSLRCVIVDAAAAAAIAASWMVMVDSVSAAECSMSMAVAGARFVTIAGSCEADCPWIPSFQRSGSLSLRHCLEHRTFVRAGLVVDSGCFRLLHAVKVSLRLP